MLMFNEKSRRGTERLNTRHTPALFSHPQTKIEHQMPDRETQTTFPIKMRLRSEEQHLIDVVEKPKICMSFL